MKYENIDFVTFLDFIIFVVTFAYCNAFISRRAAFIH